MSTLADLSYLILRFMAILVGSFISPHHPKSPHQQVVVYPTLFYYLNGQEFVKANMNFDNSNTNFLNPTLKLAGGRLDPT